MPVSARTVPATKVTYPAARPASPALTSSCSPTPAPDAEAYSEEIAVGADCDARVDVRVNGTTAVQLDPWNEKFAEPQLDGTTSIWIEASQSLLRAYGCARSSCSCLGGDTDTRADVIVNTLGIVTGAQGRDAPHGPSRRVFGGSRRFGHELPVSAVRVAELSTVGQRR